MTRALCLLLAVLASGVASAQTCTTSWAAAQSGSWSNDANWTDGAPDAADTACITAPGVYTVTLDRRQALAGLVVGGASGLQTLILGRTITTLGSGTIGARGRVEIESSENCGSCDGLPDVTGTLTVEGTLVHRNSTGLLSAGGTVDVASGGTLRVRTGINSVSMGSGTAGDRSRIIVRGTLLFDAEGQTPRSVSVDGSVDLAGGTIAVTDGRVDFSSQGTWTGGAFDVPEGGYLWFLGGAGSNGVYEVTGTLSGAPAGRVQFGSGATLTAGAGGATLDVGGTGIETFPGSGQTTYFRSAGGAFTNTGRIVARGNGLWINGATLRNQGRFEVDTGVRMEAAAVLDNASGGTVALIDGGGITGDAAGGTLRTAGRVEAVLDNNSSAVSNVSVPVNVQGGTLAATNADLRINRGGRLRDATFEVAANRALWLGSGLYEVDGTFSGTPAGFLGFVSGARAEAASGGATFDIGGTGLAVSPGSGQSVFLGSAGGAFTNRGLLTAQSNGLWLDGVTLRNEGTLDNRTTTRMLADARIVNARGATLRLVDGGGVTAGEGSGRIVNRGDLLGVTDQSTSGRSTISVPVDVENARVAAEAASLYFVGGGTWQNPTVAVAEGLDLWLYNADFDLAGTFAGTSQGNLQFTSRGTFTSASGGVTLDVDGNGIAVFPGSGQATFFQGTFTNTGRLAVSGNGLWMQGASLLNEGELIVRSSLRLNEGATLRNTAEATFEGSGSVTGDGSGGTFTNEALALKTGGSTSNFNGHLRSTPGSELRILNGRYFLTAEAPETFGAGVRLTLAAEDSASVFTNQFLQGTLSPGVPGAEIVAINHDGNLRFSDTEGDARLVIDVGPDGTGDLVNTEQQVTLGGTLVVRVQDGYTPTAGEAWTIIRDLRTSAILGDFSAIEVEGAPEGLSFVTDVVRGAVTLRAVVSVAVIAPLAEVPEGEPASFLLTHPPAAETFSIAYEVDGSATRFEDYTLGATRGLVRATPGTTQTAVTLFPRRDTNTTEGTESVIFRILPGTDASPASGAAEAGVAILDGPSSDALTLEAAVPARGQNLGPVTSTILGTGLTEGAQVRLTGPATIDGQNVALDPTGAGASATFDLADAPTGTYDVVVESGGTTETIPGGFAVEDGVLGVPVWGSISGTSAPRVGRWSTYTFTIGNDGDVDLHDTFVLLRVTDGVEYEVSGVRVSENQPDGVEDFVGIDVGEVVIVPLYFYRLPARSQRSMTVRIRPTGAPVGIGDGAGVSYELYPPNPRALFTYSGNFTDFDLDLQERRVTNWGVIGGALADALANAGARGQDPERAAADVLKQLPRGPNNPWPRDEREFNIQELNDLYGSGNSFDQNRGELSNNLPNPWAEAFAWGLGTFVLGAAVVAGSITIGTAAIIGGGVLAVASIVSAGTTAERVRCSRNQTCTSPPGGGPGSPGGTGGPGGGPGGGAGGSAGGKVGGSFDPNDKYGPFGEGGMRFYDPATATTPYTIAFENLDTATFPAQEVVVIDTLDTDVFDLSTFSLGPIRWGNGNMVMPPPGAKTYETEVDLAPEIAATLLITASLDETTGRAVWRFATLDPNTGDLPEDGTIGFLAPNVTQPEGEGYITFSVRTKKGLQTGTSVENGAEIVFDVNEPIVTPVWTNTVDITAPVSSVQPLAGTEANPFTITATGSDAGSGITTYSLFASRDGGAFEEVGQSQDGTFEFTGEEGSSYGFYTRAMDFVNNVEAAKTEAEATTMVAVDAEGVPDGPLALTLEAPRPNPARGLVRLRYGVPTSADVSVRVLDALGREVAMLASGEASAGWHVAEWHPGVASGVYVVEVRSGDEVRHERLTVVR